MGPLILIALGVLFLLNNMFPHMFNFGRMWPVILIVIGVVKIVESFQRKNRSDSLKPPDSEGKDTP